MQYVILFLIALFFNACQETFTNNTPQDTFISATQCSMCHDNIKNSADENMSIVAQYQTSMMAHSAKDPLWLAKVKSEVVRLGVHDKEVAAFIEDKCTRCHMPMANMHDRLHSITPKLFDTGYISSANIQYDNAQEGVSCSVCHQIRADSIENEETKNSGNFVINSNKELYGPYEDVYEKPMQNRIGYTPMYAKHLDASKEQSARMCASCHDLKTQYITSEGTLSEKNETFAEQMPYSEWAHIDNESKQTCAECHMPQKSEVIVSNRPVDTAKVPSRENFSQHNFKGVNSYMLGVLQENNLTNSDVSHAIADSKEFLKSAGDINITHIENNATHTDITLQVRNNIAHKLPTSFPSRRVFIKLELFDENNDTLFVSGAYDSNGSIAHNDNDINFSTYEPHYTHINSQEQVQIYETIMADDTNATTYTLLKAAHYKKDNRLLPKDFNKTSASKQIASCAKAVTDENFIGGGHTLTYTVGVAKSSIKRIEASLLYQTVSYAFMQNLYEDNSTQSNALREYTKNGIDTLLIDKTIKDIP